MTDQTHDLLIWDAQLSDRETFLIGKIVVQWGALEHEIFTQTLLTFDVPEGKQATLPSAMNNLQFTEVLSLWKERVADQAQNAYAKVLRDQIDEITRLKEFRDALVHGMWEWSPADLSRISTVRVRKKEVITTHFTADELEDFYRRVAKMNFKIRFPGGIQELARKRTEQGFYISRRGLSMLTGENVADDWLSLPLQSERVIENE